MNPQIHGKESMKCEATATVIVSTIQGVKASLITPQDNFLKATGSKPRPALIKITTNAIFLQTNK